VKGCQRGTRDADEEENEERAAALPCKYNWTVCQVLPVTKSDVLVSRLPLNGLLRSSLARRLVPMLSTGVKVKRWSELKNEERWNEMEEVWTDGWHD